MKISQLKSLIKESIKEVLRENQMSPVEMVKFKVQDFIKNGERWSDSDYEEMQEMSSGLSQKSPKVQNAYKLIRSLTSLTQQERLKKIPSIKQQISKLVPLLK